MALPDKYRNYAETQKEDKSSEAGVPVVKDSLFVCCHTSTNVNLFCVGADCAVVGYQLSEWHDLTLQMLSAVN